MSLGRALLLSTALFACIAGTALAASHPIVKLQLSGAMIAGSGDKTTATPLDKVQLKAGDLVRYTIAAKNAGSSPAVSLHTVGPVPSRTQYVAGSATRPGGAKLEYSLDGKTFSAKPMVEVNTGHGTVKKPADPAQYVALRWIAAKPLSPKGTILYSYEVRVK